MQSPRTLIAVVHGKSSGRKCRPR